MAGFFDNFTSGNVGGLLGNVAQGLGDNTGLLYGLAANGFAGAQQGMASDRAAAAMRQKEQQQAQMQRALTKFAADKGIDPAYAGSEEVFKLWLDDEHKKQQLALQDRELAANQGYRNANLGLEREKWDYTKNLKDAPEYKPYSVKNQDGSESAGFYNPRDPNQRVNLPASPPAAPGSAAFAPTTDMKNKFVEKQLVAKDLNDALNNYEALVRQHGLEPGLTEGRTALQAAHSDTLIKMKEAAKLGVLNGPDLPLMEQQLRSMTPDGIIETINPATWYNATGRTQAGIAEIRKSVRRGLDNARQAYSGRPVDLSSDPAASQAGEAGTRPVPYSREEIIAELRRRQAARGAGQ